MSERPSDVIPFPRRPEWWPGRHDPDWAVIDAALAEMDREGVLDAPSAPVLRVVR